MAESGIKVPVQPESLPPDFHKRWNHSSASVEKWIASLMTLPAAFLAGRRSIQRLSGVPKRRFARCPP